MIFLFFYFLILLAGTVCLFLILFKKENNYKAIKKQLSAHENSIQLKDKIYKENKQNINEFLKSYQGNPLKDFIGE